MAPKRGDTKTQNGVKYRYGYKKGKLQWIKVHDVLPHTGAANRLKSTWKGAKNLAGNVSRKVFGNPKTSANKKYQSETWTRKPTGKMATWRVDNKANKKLQEEHKSGSDHTYQRVTSKNKKDLSNQQVDKPSDKKSSGKKMHMLEKRNRERLGNAAVDRLKQKHAEWKKARKEGKLSEWEKKWHPNRKKKYGRLKDRLKSK